MILSLVNILGLSGSTTLGEFTSRQDRFFDSSAKPSGFKNRPIVSRQPAKFGKGNK